MRCIVLFILPRAGCLIEEKGRFGTKSTIGVNPSLRKKRAGVRLCEADIYEKTELCWLLGALFYIMNQRETKKTSCSDLQVKNLNIHFFIHV